MEVYLNWQLKVVEARGGRNYMSREMSVKNNHRAVERQTGPHRVGSTPPKSFLGHAL